MGQEINGALSEYFDLNLSTTSVEWSSGARFAYATIREIEDRVDSLLIGEVA
jgi:hypothetical protein